MKDFEERKREFVTAALNGMDPESWQPLLDRVPPGEPQISSDGDVYVYNNRPLFATGMAVAAVAMATIAIISYWEQTIVYFLVAMAAFIYCLVKYTDRSVKFYLCNTGFSAGEHHTFVEWKDVLEILVFSKGDETEYSVLVFLIYNREMKQFEQFETPLEGLNKRMLYRQLWHFWKNAAG